MVLATCGHVAAPRECWLPRGVSAFCRGQCGAHCVAWGLDSGEGERWLEVSLSVCSSACWLSLSIGGGPVPPGDRALSVEGRGVARAHPALAGRPHSSTRRTSREQLGDASVCPLTHPNHSALLCTGRLAGRRCGNGRDGDGTGLGDGSWGRADRCQQDVVKSPPRRELLCKAQRPEVVFFPRGGVSVRAAQSRRSPRKFSVSIWLWVGYCT